MPTSTSPHNLLALRYHNARPGLELVAVVDAAIPVSIVTADSLVQDRKPLPLLTEFVLRAVREGINTTKQLSGFLGLPPDMVASTVAEQLTADNLAYSYREQDKKLRLTAKGQATTRDLASITPDRVDIPVVFDRLLWKIGFYDSRDLISRGEAEEEGLLILPPASIDEIGTDTVTPAEINALLRAVSTKDREVLAVKRVVANKRRRVMPAKLLVFADMARTDIQLAVIVDDTLSDPHAHALLKLGGAAMLGISVDAPQARPELPPELERVRVPLGKVTRLQAEAATIGSDAEEPASQTNDAQSASDAERPEVRGVSVFEHPDLLDEALTTATRRLLLISPWVKKAVITTDFLSKLENRLRRKVTVHIAYGIGKDGGDSDPMALRKLENLAKRYPDHLTFSRLRNSHAKVLIFDDVWIATSFNWLSFRGDKDRTYRMEEGTLVRGASLVDHEYQRYLDLIRQETA
ncbi:hypothetical protein [Streptomyces sp. NPDC007206]|uniref:hypothetical protein n=1 Tax=Streptomyces sp. NPDC007206 TaxID=3154317 RepID=UPI0033ECEB95